MEIQTKSQINREVFCFNSFLFTKQVRQQSICFEKFTQLGAYFLGRELKLVRTVLYHNDWREWADGRSLRACGNAVWKTRVGVGMGKRAGRVCGGCLITTRRGLELLIDATKHASGFQTSSKDNDTATNSHHPYHSTVTLTTDRTLDAAVIRIWLGSVVCTSREDGLLDGANRVCCRAVQISVLVCSNLPSNGLQIAFAVC